MTELSALTQDVRRFPEFVVRGEGRWNGPSMSPATPLQGRVLLRNPGGMPATFYNPAVGGSDARFADVTLMLRVAGKSSEVVAEVLQTGEMELVDAKEKPVRTPKVVLQPGELLELRFRKAAYLAPGKYDGAVSLRLPQGDIAWDTVVCGTLSVHLGILHVANQ